MQDPTYLLFTRTWYGFTSAAPIEQFDDEVDDRLVEARLSTAAIEWADANAELVNQNAASSATKGRGKKSAGKTPVSKQEATSASDQRELGESDPELELRMRAAGWRTGKRISGIVIVSAGARSLDFRLFDEVRPLMLVEGTENARTVLEVVSRQVPNEVTPPHGYQSPAQVRLGVCGFEELDPAHRVRLQMSLEDHDRSLREGERKHASQLLALQQRLARSARAAAAILTGRQEGDASRRDHPENAGESEHPLGKEKAGAREKLPPRLQRAGAQWEQVLRTRGGDVSRGRVIASDYGNLLKFAPALGVDKADLPQQVSWERNAREYVRRVYGGRNTARAGRGGGSIVRARDLDRPRSDDR